MSTVMVMHKEMEQLHKSDDTEQTVSNHIFEFGETSLADDTQSHHDVPSHNSIMQIITCPVTFEDEEHCNLESDINAPSKPIDDSIKEQSLPPPSEQSLPPPSEPFSEKIAEPSVTETSVACQLSDGSTAIENHVSPEIQNINHETSDDDLLEELDKVMSNNESGEAVTNDEEESQSNKTDDDSEEKESLLMEKKMEALKRRLNYTIQERKHLEIENINLERKIDALLRNQALESKEILSSMEVQKEEIEDLKKKTFQQAEASRLDVLRIQAGHKREVDSLQRKIEELQKEKEEMVMRFAMAEQRNIEMTDKLQKSEVKLKDWSRERETALNRWKTMKSENKRAFDICEAQKNEINQLKKDNDKLKDNESSNDTKMKWHQNKLKAEQDGHKETTAKLLENNKIMQDLQIHSFAIFDTVRSIYSVLQDLHSSQSNQLTLPPPMPPSPKQDASVTQLLPIITKDLQTLLWKQREMVAETRTYKDKIHCLELERLSQRDELNSLRDNLKTQKQDIEVVDVEMMRLQDLEKEHERLIIEMDAITSQLRELEASHADLTLELKACSSRETENLEFNSRLLSSNSELKANNDILVQELENKSTALVIVKEQLSLAENRLSQLHLENESVSMTSTSMVGDLEKKLEEACGTIELLTTKNQDLEDEMKTTKRRYAAMVKDLRRHVTGGRRPLTSDDLKSQQDTSSLYSSHGGSSLSLDIHGVTSVNNQPSTPPSQLHSSTKQTDLPANHNDFVANGDANEEEEEDPNVVLLVKHLERKSRKIAFLKDHVDHLTNELHRKSKIIREYALREESGSLVPVASDQNKAQLAKKGGIMASLYSLNAKDSGMTLGLSMEINQKLQVLVEDTLLKNIKYKESMDLLGQEIEWLTGENKTLRGQLNNKDSTSANSEKISEIS